MTQPAEVETYRVAYDVPRQRRGWELSEQTMPINDEAVELVKAILAWWVELTGRDARVARNLAVRWDERHPRVGVDPDVCVLEPVPPDFADLASSRRTSTPRAERKRGDGAWVSRGSSRRST